MRTSILALVFAWFGFAALCEPMQFKPATNGGNCADCRWTVAQGDITESTPAALRDHIARYGPPRSLVFDSPGGNLGAALDLGRIIRENGIPTGIGRSELTSGPSFPWYRIVEGGTCESACAFAFLGGVARRANEDEGAAPRSGRLGMHQFFTLDGRDIPSSTTQMLMGQVLLYILEMGINAELLGLAARTPPDRMYFFSAQELRDLSVITLRGSEPRGLFLDRGGLAVGWRLRAETGMIARDVTLRCSGAAGGWVLRVRDHAAASGATGIDQVSPDNLMIRVGERMLELDRESLLTLTTDGDDEMIEVLLPDDLPSFPEEHFSFRTNGLRPFLTALSADETLPDAETFSVLARACGD